MIAREGQTDCYVDEAQMTESVNAGVLLAASADGLRLASVQHHPEYHPAPRAGAYEREAYRDRGGERTGSHFHPPYSFQSLRRNGHGRQRSAV